MNNMFGLNEASEMMTSKKAEKSYLKIGLVSGIAFALLFIFLLGCFIYSQVRDSNESKNIQETYDLTDASVSSCQDAYVTIKETKKYNRHSIAKRSQKYETDGYKVKVTQGIYLTYTYNGQEYTVQKDDIISESSYGKNSEPTEESVKEEVASMLYKTGDTVQVYVNPENPAEIELQKDVDSKAL